MSFYYIDYDNGNDVNNGTSTVTPWKHCPGDTNATNNAASTTLTGGDSVLFKGQTRYLGEITINNSGFSLAAPITLLGTGYGTGRAILDGSVPLTGNWTQCTGSGDCFGNPNWNNIWYTDTAFSGQTSLNTVILSGEFLGFAQDVTPQAPIYFDVVSTWRTVPSGNVSLISLSNTGYFVQSQPNFWTGAYVGIHKSPNSVSILLITGYNVASGQIIFNPLGNTDFYNPTPYSIIGHPYNINTGQYGVINGRFYLWPPNNVNPSGLSLRIAKLGEATKSVNKHFITIDGFDIIGYYGDLNQTYVGYGYSQNGSSTCKGIKIINNAFSCIRSMTKGPVINIQPVSGCYIIGNTIDNCLRSRGVIGNGFNIDVLNNRWTRMGGTTIYFAQVSSGNINNNFLSGIRGTHGNGISVYQLSKDIIVDKNFLIECGSPITYEYSHNVSFYNNFVDCSYGVVDEWGYMSGIVNWFNNTLVKANANMGGPYHISLNLDRSSSTAAYQIKNNVLDGLSWNTYPTNDTGVVHQYNLWVGYSSSYAAPTFSTGEIYNTNQDAIFVNPSGNNYQPKLGSIIIGSGANLSQYFTTDINGTARTVPWTIGAYAYIVYAFKRLGHRLKLKGLALV